LNLHAFKEFLENKKGWQKGSLIGFIVFLPIFSFVVILCLSEFSGISREGYIAAGWVLLFFGLPTSLIGAILENFEISFFMQIVNLLILVFVQYVIGGGIIGHYFCKKPRRLLKR